MSCKWGGNTNTITSEGKEEKKQMKKIATRSVIHAVHFCKY